MRKRKGLISKNGVINYVQNAIDIHKENLISKEDIKKVLDEEVFSNLDFKRHIKEVSIKTEFSEDIVRIVLQQYITILAMQMTIVTRYRRKLMMFGFFMIDIMDPVSKKLYNKTFTEDFYLKYMGKIFYKKILSIFKI